MPSILVVESERSITRLINDALGHEEYRVVTFFNSEDAFQFVLRDIPCLIILDVMLPGVDGYSVVQKMRDHPKCMHIPILMISAYSSVVDKVRAYEAGVDNYLCKPFYNEELLALVRRHLQRAQQCTLSPLTQLPGGLQLERAIDYKLSNAGPWSILYLDLDNFKAFNDVYGFLAGNDMILLVSHICQRIVYESGNVDDFVGHVGGDDFVIVTTPDREKTLCREILTHYAEESVVLYRQDDLDRGSISGVDRKGRPYQFPLVSLSIGIVCDQVCCSYTIDEVGSLTAEAKRRAKLSSNNISRISLEWNASLQERMRAVPPSANFNLVGPFGRCLFQFTEEDVCAEFK